MDFLGWIVWLITSVLSFAWSIVWFLLGGWVATLVQLGIIITAVFAYKYGWRRAPLEVATRLRAFGRFVWAWARAREAMTPSADPRTSRREIRVVYRRQRGDVNVSTVLSVLTLLGLGVLALT